jgi:hypothetical protein
MPKVELTAAELWREYWLFATCSDAGGGAKTMASARTYLEQLAGDQDIHI